MDKCAFTCLENSKLFGFILCFSSSCSSFLAPVHKAVVRQRICALSKGLQQVCRLKVYTAAVQMRYVLYLGALSHSMMVIKLIQATFALAVESLPPFSTPPTSSVSYLSLYFSFFDEQERTTRLQPCLKLCSVLGTSALARGTRTCLPWQPS